MPIPALNDEFIKEKTELIFSPPMVKARMDDQDRWMMFNGSIKEIVMRALQKEFTQKQTLLELEHRMIPLNVLGKIINKLSNVYNEAPIRKASDKNEQDQILLQSFIDAMDLNVAMKEANRYFKLFKRNLMFVYVTEEGSPGARNLPRHTYEVFSHSEVSPHRPDTFAVIHNPFENDRAKVVISWWTDLEHVMADGYGGILKSKMASMNNSERVNPIKKAPFIYSNQSTYSVAPIPADDLLRMGIVFPIILSDLAYAIKYLSWAVVYIVGAGDQDIPFNPNSLIKLPFGPNGETPSINTVKPEVDIEKVLNLVEMLVATLLSTNNLSSSTIANKLSADSPASGIAKALDSAESMEDKKDQQGYFAKAEADMWKLISKFLVPYWRSNRMLRADLNREFSSSFDLEIHFIEPKVIVSEKDQAEMLVYKRENMLCTQKMVIETLYPNFGDDEIDGLMLDIVKDVSDRKASRLAELLPGEGPEVGGFHSHKGLDSAPSGVLHRHEAKDGSGYSSTDEYDDDHVHEMPDGSLSGPPIVDNKGVEN